MPVLTVENIYKNYGKIEALKNVSFSVPAGSVFGILGPNGSGKTTLLGIIMNVLRSTKGSFKLFDQTAGADQRKQIGTLLETPNFYHYLTGQKNLEIAAAIKKRSKEDIPRVLEIVNLTQRKNSKFSTYSLGMKQRLAIASCLLGNPEVIVFDEPTNGLDPEGIAEIRQLIKNLNHNGKTIIMASHLLDEVEKVCTHVAILKKGELLTTGDVNEIFANDDIVEISAVDVIKLKALIAQMDGYKLLNENGNLLQITYPAGKISLEGLNKYCFNNGIILNHMTQKRKSLEARFFEITNN